MLSLLSKSKSNIVKGMSIRSYSSLSNSLNLLNKENKISSLEHIENIPDQWKTLGVLEIFILKNPKAPI